MDSGIASSELGLLEEPRNEKRHGSVSLEHLRSNKMQKPGETGYPFGGGLNLWLPENDAHKLVPISPSLWMGGGGVYGSGGSPFTPSQWMELEHHALIHRYIAANVPVPPNLLLPLKRSHTSDLLRWGSFPLGFSGDAEPGRCRRTDGKKWRCSRDAVPDQKYCERHINRGRPRSRKPVEGQNGHASSSSSSQQQQKNQYTCPATSTISRGGGVEGSNSKTSATAGSDFGSVSNPFMRFSREEGSENPNLADWTQLSMTSSPKPSALPYHDLELIQMSLGINNYLGESTKKQSWLPVSWGNSVGGPLAEVLTTGGGGGGIHAETDGEKTNASF